MNDITVIVLSVMGILILVLLLMILRKMNHGDQGALDRIEQSVGNTEKDLIQSQEAQKILNKNFEIILKETIKTKEFLGVSDAKLNSLSKNINDINAIMVNTKKRGNFGEYQLYHLLSLYCGDTQEVYTPQYPLANGKIGDAAMHIPGSDLVMIIDSKFPSENYLRIVEDPTNTTAISEFKMNVKKHILDIANKYITPQTVEEAIMFVPSEAIYLYICEEQSDLIEEAHRKHVLITSPSTLMGVVFTLVNITRDFNRSQNMEKLEQTIIRLKEDSDRMLERYEKAANALQALSNHMNMVGTSVNKVSTKINQVYDGYEMQEED